jgi:hypothetical protein
MDRARNGISVPKHGNNLQDVSMNLFSLD